MTSDSDPYRPPLSESPQFLQPRGRFRTTVGVGWALGLLGFFLFGCIGLYFEGRFSNGDAAPVFLLYAWLGSPLLSLVCALAFPATIGRRMLHFSITIVATIILFYFAVFFSMAYLGFDIMD